MQRPALDVFCGELASEMTRLDAVDLRLLATLQAEGRIIKLGRPGQLGD